MTMESEINEAMLRGLAKEQASVIHTAVDILEQARLTILELTAQLSTARHQQTKWKRNYYELLAAIDEHNQLGGPINVERRHG